MINIDGSFGEGGGQILRTALGLSLLTGQPFTLERIRANRSRPGILAQHLAAIRASTLIGHALVSGDTIGSAQMSFQPFGNFPGVYDISVGTAGSTALVFQTILPALLNAEGSSVLTFEGGTHNPGAPSYHFLESAFVPLLTKMNAKVKMSLITPGFYPAGGGKMQATVHPQVLQPVDLVRRGILIGIRAKAYVSKLNPDIGVRELKTVRKRFGQHPLETELIEVKDSPGPGNALVVEVKSEHITEVFTGFGQKGRLAEDVASELCNEVQDYLEAGAPVGERLADQLLIPFALAGRGAFSTSKLSLHTQTNIDVIKRFLNIDIHVREEDGRHTIAFHKR